MKPYVDRDAWLRQPQLTPELCRLFHGVACRIGCAAESEKKMCVCDAPACERFPCRDLRELRIVHRVVSQIVGVKELGVETIRDLLDHVETECEILCK